MQQINFTKGDYGILINVSVVDNNKAPVNLTGCTVKADVVKPDGSVSTVNLTISNASGGIAQLTIDNTLTAQEGDCRAYIYVTNTGYKVTATASLNYTVLPLNGGV